MYSTIRAVVDLLSVFFVEEKPKPVPKPKTQVDMEPPPKPEPRNFTFTCYLCSAETKFTMEPVAKKTFYHVDCIRCGYENRVVVKPAVK